MIVPHVTSCYNDTQDPTEEQIPMCTLHNFPSMIEHCIEWGRDHFNGYFTDIIRDAYELLNDPSKYYNDLKKEGNATLQLDKLENINKLINIMRSKSLQKCIEYAIDKYTENFDHKIKQLLHNFPSDYTNPDGSKFWSGSKRVPTPLPYNWEDPIHRDFVVTTAFLIAQACNINVDMDKNKIAEVSGIFKVPEFKPKKVHIKINDTDPDVLDIGKEEEEKLSNLMKQLSLADKEGAINFKPHEFEKDDDANGHIDFINAGSNLRARNYRIQECDKQKTKMIAGKIIPAIATTTAAITGLVSLQIYTLFQTKNITFMRNAFINLAVSLFVLTEPGEKIFVQDKDYDQILLGPVKAIPPKWTVWDRIEVNGPMTVRQFFEYIKKTYSADVSIITTRGINIIQTIMKTQLNRLDLKIEDIYETNSKSKIDSKINYLPLEISADTLDGTAALMPMVKYHFR